MTSRRLLRRLSCSSATAALVALVALATGALACRPVPPAGSYASFDPSETDYYVADPVAFHLHRPRARRWMAWSEHRHGQIEMTTNNLGFREDADTAPVAAKDTYRILVTGDSHTDGVVPNPESFANRLELYLGLTSPNRAFEVINGGVGYYGPFQYRGFATRQAALAPRLLIVNLFLGNDFLDACRELEARPGGARPRPPEYRDRLARAAAEMPGTVAQGLNQLYYFKTFPEMIEPAMEATAGQLIELAEESEHRGAPLLVSLMPSQIEIAPDDPEVRRHLDRAAELLGVGPRELELQRQLRLDLQERLFEAGVAVIDLFPAFAEAPDGLFWRWDEHLSTKGHDKLARLLCAELGAGRDLPCEATDTAEVFSDGFESGDLSKWKVVAEP